jgi:putative Holliday junction resolvase
LAFDFGLRNIGVAVGQELIGTATPLAHLKARDGVPDWYPVQQLIMEWRPDLLLVGLPLNMDDSESEMAARARKFSRRLEARFQLPCTMMDERLSSFEAKSIAADEAQWRDYGKDPVDSLAAKLILESWFADQAANK